MALGRMIVAATAGLVALVAVAAPAQAQSLVFVKPDGNVWIANPTGTGQQRVTADGTSANPYYSPSQSNTGTIEAARGTGSNARLYRLSSTGARLNAPFTVPTPALVDPVISPDGSKVAIWTLSGGEPCNTNMYCFEVSRADRYDLLTTPAWMTFQRPAWLGNARLLLFNGSGQLSYADLGRTGYQTWLSWFTMFHTADGQWIEGAASADGTRLALVTHLDSESRFVIKFFSGAVDTRTADLTSYEPTLSPCTVTPPDGTAGADPQHSDLPAFHSLSFSPAGDAVAFGYKGTIYTARVADCAVRRLIAPGSDPNWGTANVPVMPALTVSVAKTSIAGLVRGMKVKVTLSVSGTVTLKLGRGHQTIASGRLGVTARRAKTMVLKPSAGVAKTLKSLRQLRATLTVSIVGRAQPVVVKQLTLGR